MSEPVSHYIAPRTAPPRGLIGRLMRLSYERIGFHPVFPFVPGFLVGAAGPVTLALYFDMSSGQFVRILLAAELGIWLPELIVARAIVSRRARPLLAWIAAPRGGEHAIAAWRAGTTLPRDLLRHPAPYLMVATTALGFDFYAASELDLPAFGGGLVIFLGSIVQYSFWAVLRLFILEAMLRPPLEAISEHLPEDVHLEVPRMPLGRRLLIALPVMNLAMGTVLAGIFAGNATLGDFMLGILGATIVTLTVSVWLIAFISDSVATSMRDLRDGARRIGRGELGARVPVASTDETGELAQSFNEMAAGLAERERIREAFGTYVDRDVAEHILREGTSLAGEEVEVTMLFLDIRGFTTFAERLSASEVVATLNRLFERIVPIIHEHHGHVDKYVGDGLLAVFGAPRRQDDHADQALATGLEIAAAVSDEFGDRLSVGIGLNSGAVVAGNVGGAGRLEFSVIGDAVNVAARVESATRQTGDAVLIAERTRELLAGVQMDFAERPGLMLKGKTQPVAIYAPVVVSSPVTERAS